MKLKLGQLIIDTTGGCRDTGVVARVYEGWCGEYIYSIYWVCPRELGGYTTTLAYTEEELEMEYSHCFEVIELK
jgi:hypothetical protein